MSETRTVSGGSCWRAVGQPMGTSSGCHTSPSAAINEAYHVNNYSYNLYPCNCPGIALSKAEENVTASTDSDAHPKTTRDWSVYEVYVNRNGKVKRKPIHMKNAELPEEAARSGLEDGENYRNPPSGGIESSDNRVILSYMISDRDIFE